MLDTVEGLNEQRLLNFSNSLNLNKLEFTHSVDLVDNKELYKCNQCDLKSFSWIYMKNHISHKHLSEGRVFKCDVCDKNFSYQTSVKLHKMNVHDRVPHPCGDCDFVARNESIMRYHIRTKHTLEKFSCDNCSYKCTTETVLKQHINKKHSEFTLKCNKIGCKFETIYPNKLTNHIKKFHDDLICKVCGWKATFRNHLLVHEKTKHVTLLLGSCDHCRFSPTSITELNMHKFCLRTSLHSHHLTTLPKLVF